MRSVTLQHFGADHFTISHMKAMDVPFHMRCSTRYVWLIRWLTLENHYFINKYLGIWVHMKAIYVLFQLIYGSLIYSKGLQSERPKWRGMHADPSWTSLCKAVSKTILEWCENRRSLSFLPVTWLFVGVGQAIIPHLKEEIQGYLLIWKSGPLSNW